MGVQRILQKCVVSLTVAPHHIDFTDFVTESHLSYLTCVVFGDLRSTFGYSILIFKALFVKHGGEHIFSIKSNSCFKGCDSDFR